MVKVNTRRLLVLARYLEKVPPRRFKMTIWGEGKIAKSYATGCGFAGCAMGHAAFIPSFRKAGLMLKEQSSLDGTPNWTIAIKGRRLVTFGVAAWLFGINTNQATYLFAGEDRDGENRGDETPKQVAARIREFVEDIK